MMIKLTLESFKNGLPKTKKTSVRRIKQFKIGVTKIMFSRNLLTRLAISESNRVSSSELG